MTAVAHPRGDLDEETRRTLAALVNKRDAITDEIRAAVVAALAAGGSFRAVHDATGISTTTLQRWKREHSDVT